MFHMIKQKHILLLFLFLPTECTRDSVFFLQCLFNFVLKLCRLTLYFFSNVLNKEGVPGQCWTLKTLRQNQECYFTLGNGLRPARTPGLALSRQAECIAPNCGSWKVRVSISREPSCTDLSGSPNQTALAQEGTPMPRGIASQRLLIWFCHQFADQPHVKHSPFIASLSSVIRRTVGLAASKTLPTLLPRV